MLELLLDWGVTWVLWLQQASPALDLPMTAITLLGEAAFYVVFFPLLYWCIDRRLAVRLMLLFVLSIYVNSWAKEWVNQPRPPAYDPRVIEIVPYEGGGLPSGHAQSTVAVWGYVAGWVRRPWTSGLFVLMLVLIPFSRLYLGAHFPTDLLGGLLLGALLLFLYTRYESSASSWLTAQREPLRLAMVAIAPPLLVLTLPDVHERQIDAALLLAGAGLGAEMARLWVRQIMAGPPVQLALRFLVGGLTSAGLCLALETVAAGTRLGIWANALLYFPLGLWLTAGVPWLFVRLRLADRTELESTP